LAFAIATPYLLFARCNTTAAHHERSHDMNANLSSNPTTGAATSGHEVTGAIQPGLTLLGFRDASRLAFRDKHSADKQKQAKSRIEAGHVHAAFTGLVALGSIAMLALGR
jgi:hypothetical protein